MRRGRRRTARRTAGSRRSTGVPDSHSWLALRCSFGMVYSEPEFRFRFRLYGMTVPLVNAMTTTTTDTQPAFGEKALRADARRNRDAVLAAAKKLFADQGLPAQMPDVAKAAKVGVGPVYRHFPTKEDLIAALVAERF